MIYKKYLGPEIAGIIEEVAELRISVFKEYPYLYEGSKEYERNYLQRYLSVPESFLFAIFEGSRLVGAATATPLVDECDEFKIPFGGNAKEFFYLGEHILLPEFRGRGYGNKFFEVSLRHAKKNGYNKSCFAAVDRSDNHRLCPKNYKNLSGLWAKHGFLRSGLFTKFIWKDIDKKEESEHKMTFYINEKI